MIRAINVDMCAQLLQRKNQPIQYTPNPQAYHDTTTKRQLIRHPSVRSLRSQEALFIPVAHSEFDLVITRVIWTLWFSLNGTDELVRIAWPEQFLIELLPRRSAGLNICDRCLKQQYIKRCVRWQSVRSCSDLLDSYDLICLMWTVFVLISGDRARVNDQPSL